MQGAYLETLVQGRHVAARIQRTICLHSSQMKDFFCKTHNNIVYGKSLHVAIMASYIGFHSLLDRTDVDNKNDGEEQMDEGCKMDIEDKDENQDKQDKDHKDDNNGQEDHWDHENRKKDKGKNDDDDDSCDGDEYFPCTTVHGRDYQCYAIENDVHFMPVDEVSGSIFMSANDLCVTGDGGVSSYSA